MTTTPKWIRADKFLVLRLDLLERFGIDKIQEDLLKSPPNRSMGGPGSRLYEVRGWFRDGDKLSVFILREGIKSWDNAERAISRVIKLMGGENPWVSMTRDFIEMSDGERSGEEP